jgi:peptide-methionine (R)-S-oxide reductase
MTRLTIIIAVILAIGAVAYSTNHAEEQDQPMDAKSSPSASPLQRAGEAAKDPAAFPDAPGVDPEKIDWSKVDWRKRLSRDEFAIMRLADTERAFTGEYWDFFEKGAYKCRGCGLALFESDAKFDSHCGWPSFDKVAVKGNVVEIEDNSHGMHRVEVRCRRCDAHLGHIFDDGPTDTGMRYCINSPSIKFVPAESESNPAPASPLQRAGAQPTNPAPPNTP